MRALVFVLALSVTTFGASGPTSAQKSAVPDFSGQWARVGRYVESFEPPPSGPGPIAIDPAHPHRRSPIPGLQSPDGWVADLSNPILKPTTVARMKPIVAAEIAGHPHLKMVDMCYPPGVPMVLNQRDPMQILQTPDEVMIIYSRDTIARHIYLDRPHSKAPGHTWWGESVGHYEGNNTLVVDTIGLNDRTYTDRFFTPHSDQIHVIERYKVASDRKTMQVLVTVDDPVTFTMSWSAQVTYGADETPYEEIVCAENNRGVHEKLISESNRVVGFYPTSPPTATKSDF